MAIPSPSERPDLYDGYDGLTDSKAVPDIKVPIPPDVQKMMDARAGKKPAQPKE